MTALIEQTYMAAIALNNLGVSLLERRQYVEAVSAFNDAVALLQNSSTLQPIDIDARLAKASHDLALCLKKPSTQPGSLLQQQQQQQEIQLCVITEEDIASSVREALRDAVENPRVVKIFLIRIELSATCIVDGKTYLRGLEHAIILQNFAGAYLCKGWEASTVLMSSAAEAYYKGAFGLLELAGSNLAELSTHHQHAEEMRSHIVPLSILVLQNLDRITSALGLSSVAYYEAMLDLLEYFVKKDVLYACCLDAAAAAA